MSSCKSDNAHYFKPVPKRTMDSEVNMNFVSHELASLAEAKRARYAAKVKQARLLREARAPAGLRTHLVLLLHRMVERLAPELERFNQRKLARTRVQRQVVHHEQSGHETPL